MKILIIGGLGFVGRKLTATLSAQGNTITVIGRNPGIDHAFQKNVSLITADASGPGAWQDLFAGHDTVINLAGVSIFTRWSARKKEEIRNSRILITRNIVEAIKKQKKKNIDLLNASAVGFYGFHEDEEITEKDGPGQDFLARVCRDWEAEASAAQNYGSRVVLARFGVVLGRGGGAMAILGKLFKLGLGSRLGSGDQWFSWIHEDDLASIFQFLIKTEKISGPVNCASPNPVTNRDMTKILNQVLGKFPLVPPIPGFALNTALGEFGDFLLKGQRVVPKRLVDAGFKFDYPDLKTALKNIIGRK
jgi:uncharacterized protein